MTSTTSSQTGCGYTDVNPDAEQRFHSSTSVAPGVTLTLDIVGDKETTDQGNQALRALSEAIAPSVQDMDASRYVFTYPVQRSVTVQDLDDVYTATVTFQPSKRRDLRSGTTESSALTTLAVAVANAHSTIAERAMWSEAFSNEPAMSMVVLVGATSSPSRRGRRFPGF